MMDFLSYGDTFIDFNKDVTLISGRNYDDVGQYSNGSGKSSILEAIYFALSGTSLRGVQARELIRRGKNSATICLTLVDSFGKDLQIVREIFETKSQKATFVIDGVKQDFASVSDCNSGILQFLKVDKDLLSNYIVTSDKFQPFLKSTDGEKKALISKLTGEKSVDIAISNVKIEEKEEEVKLSQKKYEIGLIEGSISEVEKSIVSENEKRDKLVSYLFELEQSEAFDEEVKIKKAELEEIEIKIANAKALFEKLKSEKAIDDKRIDDEVVKLQNSLSLLVEPKESNYKSENDEIIELKNIYNELKNDKQFLDVNYSKNKSQIGNLEVKIKGGFVKCGKCSEMVSISGEETLENLNTQIDVLKDEKKKKESKSAEMSGDLVILENGIKELESDLNAKKLNFVTLKREHSKKIFEIEGQIHLVKVSGKSELDISKAFGESSTLESTKFKKEIELTEAKSKKQKAIDNERSKITSIDFNTVNFRENLKDKKKTLSVLKNEYDNQEYALEEKKESQVQIKKFKSWLAVKVLKSLEILINNQLREMNSDIECILSGFSETSGGELRDKISISLTRDGLDTFPYGSLSAGEKARVNLASLVAIQKLTTNITDCKLNFVMLDEVLDAVDIVGLQEIVGGLVKLNQQIFVVSQHEIKVAEATSLLSIKKDGNTKIEMK
jgi:exonuclease SbcC